MKLFMLKSFLLAGFMFAIALGGMQMANDGIGRLKGYEDPEFKNAVSLEKEQSGEVKVAIMGGEVSGEDLDERKQQLEDMEAFNLFSEMGKGFSTLIRGAARGLVNSITE